MGRETGQSPREPSTGSIEESAIRRRLLLEAAIEEGYSVRLERRSQRGRTSIRITKPIRLEVPEGSAGGILVTRSDGHEIAVALDEVDSVSIVTTQLRSDQERSGRYRIGDAVSDEAFGTGVVQAFEDAGRSVVVRFESHGSKTLPLAHTELRPLS